MQRPFSALLVACAALLAVPSGAAALSGETCAKAAKSNALLVEDTLDAFFRDLDRKSKTLSEPADETPAEVPDFPERAALLARFEARLPRIDELRAKHIVGETNRGFLELRGEQLNVDLGAMHEENTDRLALYEAIANRLNARVDEVGRLRAAKIATLCRRGVWVQDARGKWTQKI